MAFDNREQRLRGSALQSMRRRVAEEQPLCPACKAKGIITAWHPAGQLDHVQPIHKGGGNDRSNLVGLCAACHLAKTANDMGFKAKAPRVAVDADGWPIGG